MINNLYYDKIKLFLIIHTFFKNIIYQTHNSSIEVLQTLKSTPLFLKKYKHILSIIVIFLPLFI